jgi:hypothetical protein
MNAPFRLQDLNDETAKPENTSSLLRGLFCHLLLPERRSGKMGGRSTRPLAGERTSENRLKSLHLTKRLSFGGLIETRQLCRSIPGHKRP